MLYTTVSIKDKEYKCRLNARACVELEKKLGTNPLNLFINNEAVIPSLSNLLEIFHQSLVEYQHGITMDDTYKLYDEYCEDGNDITTFVQLIINIFKDAGFVPKEVESGNKKRKNL